MNIDVTLPRSPGVYCITDLSNGKVYVGSSVNIFNRCKTHFRRLDRHEHPSNILQSVYLKHGSESFAASVLELCDRSILVQREQYWIDSLNSTVGNKGYNVAPKAYSCLGIKRSDETRKKLSESLKGKVVSEQSREKLRLANIGKKASTETRAKMSASQMGHPGYMAGRPAHNKGISPSDEVRAKMSAARKGKPSWNKGVALSEEMRHQMSIRRKGVAPPNKGKRASEETKAKLRCAWERRKLRVLPSD